MSTDVVIACVDLVGRCGASGFEMAWTCPHVPDEEDDHNCPDVTWNASVTFHGARIIIDHRHTPTEAALALAERLLRGATCRCRRPVTTFDEDTGSCRWRLVGARWEPGCDVEPVTVDAQRGDLGAMAAAMAQPMNRRDRRKLKRQR